MLHYFVIILDDASTSYCQYQPGRNVNLIPIEYLEEGIFWGMKHNLNIQFVYPDYELPNEYKDVINTIDHSDIVSSLCEDAVLLNNADIVVFNEWTGIMLSTFKSDRVYTLRTLKEDLFDRYKSLSNIIKNSKRLNLIISDIDSFLERDFETYKIVLQYLSGILKECYAIGKSPQLNILTDRMMLDDMNNCNAGIESITLAPDGKFYVCPAFYYAGVCDGSETSQGDVCQKGYAIGNLTDGLDIKNQQLYKIDHAPICRNCDAYQCKRCIWLNRKMTYEVNTPSHEQCVVAHLERNAARQLLADIRTLGTFLPEKEIKEINYLDPFEIELKRNGNT